MKRAANQKGIALILEVFVLAVVLIAAFFVYAKVKSARKAQNLVTAKTPSGQTIQYDQGASRGLTDGHCDGVGSTTIVPPMKLEQIGSIQPYGLMVGGHVTPIDHQYYLGPDINSLRDTYDVVAPADGWLVSIQHRGQNYNTPPHTKNQPSSDEYRMVFAHSCSFLTYVDLVTSIDDHIKAQWPGWDPHDTKGFKPIKIKQGEVIGHIGGQTLDFAVWDLSQKPLGFIDTSAYQGESWKIFTAPTTKFLDPSIKAQVIAKYLRTVEPIDGKIDYDQDGKLIGTWFLKGTNGYQGTAQPGTPGYWAGHLSFAPNYIDPTKFIISMGNYPGQLSYGNNNGNPPGANAQQFGVVGNTPDPATVSVSSNLVKYELVQQSLILPDGQRYGGQFATGITAQNSSDVQGVVLVQLTQARELKFEVFPGKTAAQVTGFDSGAKTYTRSGQ